MRGNLNDAFGRFRHHPLRFEIPGCVIVEKLEEGGFSTIYRAYQPQLRRWVAVKVLDPRHFSKQHLRSRFEQECAAQGMLGDHPHVARIFEAGISKSGSPYIVMEYLPAGSLADRLDADGSLPCEEALTIGVKLAGALQSAHQAGVLHRDVKPANVLVTPDGEPKLADFGISRLRAGSEAAAATQTLAFTAGYAAPELFEGEAPTAASDVYGLGATLFTLLVGHSPFLRAREEKPNVEVMIGRTIFGPVPELDPGFPESLRAVVRRAMSKKAAQRFESAAEFGEALRRVQHDQGLAATSLHVVDVQEIPQEPPPPSTRHRRSALVGLVMAVALVAGIGGVVAWPDSCAEAETVPADGVLSLGTLLPKTGQFLYLGPAMQAGVQLAMEEITATGGIPGIAVKLDEADRRDEGNSAADTASQSTDALLTGGVDVIIGPGTSAVTARVIDKVVCSGVILFSPSSAAPLFSTYDDHGLYFRTAPSSDFQGQALGKLVLDDGNSTAVVIARGDPYGNSLQQEIERVIENSGAKILDSFSYRPGAFDHARTIQRVKNINPDAIVLIGFTESATVLAAMVEQGLGPRSKKVYGTPANMTNTLARQVNPQDPSVLIGMRGIQPDAGGEAFVARLREIDPGLQDVAYAAHAYDAVVVTALAAAIAGTDAPAAVAEQINGVTRDGEKCADFSGCMDLVKAGRDIDYDGVSGPLEFTDPGEPSSATYVISEFQADGSLQPLRRVEAIAGLDHSTVINP